MTDKTYWKYERLYNANRGCNDVFDRWLEVNYEVTVSTAPWSYGKESFRSKDGSDAHAVILDAHVMQRYVREKLPYFEHGDEWWDWSDSGMDLTQWFQNRHSKKRG